jgi:hypothetical protein
MATLILELKGILSFMPSLDDEDPPLSAAATFAFGLYYIDTTLALCIDECWPTLVPPELRSDVAALRDALRDVLLHREAFKAFSAFVGAPALRAHGLAGVSALVGELERSRALRVALVADSTALGAAISGGAAAAATVVGGVFVLSLRVSGGPTLHARLLHLRLRSGTTCLLSLAAREAAGAPPSAVAAAGTELLVTTLPQAVKEDLEAGVQQVEEAHVVVAEGV